MASVLKTFNLVAKNAVNFAKLTRINLRNPAVLPWYHNSTWELASRCQAKTLFQHHKGYQYASIMDVRPIHTSVVRKDLDTAMKSVGSGLATVGVIGPGIGVGVVFGCLMLSFSRNPSLKQELFSFAILGFAMTEAIALFALALAFMIKFV